MFLIVPLQISCFGKFYWLQHRNTAETSGIKIAGLGIGVGLTVFGGAAIGVGIGVACTVLAPLAAGLLFVSNVHPVFGIFFLIRLQLAVAAALITEGVFIAKEVRELEGEIQNVSQRVSYRQFHQARRTRKPS